MARGRNPELCQNVYSRYLDYPTTCDKAFADMREAYFQQ